MFKIVIDPGHGGTDRANRGAAGYIEADAVLDISKRFKDYMESRYKDVSVYLTRTSDTTVSLTARGRCAVAYKADLFISKHTNAGGGSGSEVIYSIDLPGDKALAAKLSKGLADAFSIPDRGAKTRESTVEDGEDYYTVIDVAQDGGVKHVFIIESMFHDNAKEEALLLDPTNRERIAHVIADIVAAHFGLEKYLTDAQAKGLDAINFLHSKGRVSDPTTWRAHIINKVTPGLEYVFIKWAEDAK